MKKIILILLLFINLNSLFAKEIQIPYTHIPHLDTAIYYCNLGVKEKTNNNDGKYVEMFQKKVNTYKGAPWCAAFVSYVLDACKDILLKIRSALAQNFITKNSISAKSVMYGRKKIPSGSLVIWKNGETIKGHIGFVYVWDKVNGQTIEGNVGNKIAFLTRKIEPRNYQRIVKFTLVTYPKPQQMIIDKIKVRWYSKDQNNNTDINSTR